MSLESKIDKLNATMELLIVALTQSALGANVASSAIAEHSEGTAAIAKELEKSEKDKSTAKKINKESKDKALKEHAEKKSTAEATEDANTDGNPSECVLSAEDLKSACLKAARSAPDAKAKVKKLLSEFDATVVKDVAPADRQTIFDRLESGEY